MNITIDVKHGAVKRALALAGGIAVIGGVVAIAHAVPTMFADGDVLTASQLNGNFADLEDRVAALEADKVVLQTGTVGDSLQNGSWTLEETGDNVFDIAVTFSPAFSRVPKVLVVLKNVDAGTTAAHMMIDATAVNVTKNGCTIRFSDYSDSASWGRCRFRAPVVMRGASSLWAHRAPIGGCVTCRAQSLSRCDGSPPWRSRVHGCWPDAITSSRARCTARRLSLIHI